MENHNASQSENKIYHSFEELSEIAHKNEEEIITDIKNKALKATLEALQPLLDKLEEAAKQQPREVHQNSIVNYENQLEKLQVAAVEKMKLQEQRIQARMQTLQQRMAKHQ